MYPVLPPYLVREVQEGGPKERWWITCVMLAIVGFMSWFRDRASK